MKRILAATLAALTAVAVLTSCSTHDDVDPTTTAGTSSPSSGGWNQEDVMFAQMMVPHHEQAIAMADTLLAKDGVDPRVVDLATDIKAAQAPQIDQLKAWLKKWGINGALDSTHMGHGDGMMTDADMQALADADGQGAGKVFLEQMIVHHQGAITMAQTEVDKGSFAGSVTMAQEIIDSQTAEITTMAGIASTM